VSGPPAPGAPSRGAPSPNDLGVAILGTGVIAETLANALDRVAGASLRLVVGRRAEPASLLAGRHQAAWTDDLTGWQSTPAADTVDVVVVATPSGTHADLVVAALEAGKDVLVEKPLDVTLEAADRVIDAERRTGGVVAVVSQHRFDEATERVVQAARSGELGRLTSAIASCAWWRPQAYYDSGSWRGTWELDGGGATMNQAIHLIDLLVAVMGEPVEVTARIATLAHQRIAVEDTGVATVKFASGALGVVHATTAAFPGVEASLRVYGDRGSAVVVDDELAYLHTATDGTAVLPARGEAVALGPGHERQLRDLVDVIRSRRAGDQGARPRVGTAEGRSALALVLAMYESARSGRPVRI